MQGAKFFWLLFKVVLDSNLYFCYYVYINSRGVYLNEKNEITTLGRGGSDTTAVAIASALNCDNCYIFSDVDGVYTADPNKITNTKNIYPDVIKKELPRFKEEFKDEIADGLDRGLSNA